MFPLDPEVKEHAVVLVVTILLTVEQVIMFYEKNIVRKTFSAIFRGEEYQDQVLQGLTGIENKSTELARQVDTSFKIHSQQHIRKTDRLNRDTNDRTRMIDIRTGNIEGNVENMVDVTNKIFHMMDDFQRKKDEEIAALRRDMTDFFTQTVRSITPTPAPATVWQPPAAVSPGDRDVTPESLWRLVQIGQAIEEIDMDMVRDKQESLPSAERAKARQIVNIAEFKSWMTSTRPVTLLLHGVGVNLGGVSAFSMLSTVLTHTLRQREGFVALTHFCGLHADEDEPYYGGTALLRSFIAQLLCQQPFDTDSIQNAVDLAGAERGQVTGLCQVFGWLVNRLPEQTTLVCIVDEVAYYERDAAIDEALDVMGYISHMLYEQRLKATIKLLATSTIAVREMREFFPEDSIVDLSGISGSGFLNSDSLQREIDGDFAE